MKRNRLILGSILVFLFLSGISFVGGILYQNIIGATSASSFPAPQDLSGGPVMAGNPAITPGVGVGDGIQGQIENIDGNTLTINSGQNSVQVIVSNATTITKSATGVTADIHKDDKVQVIGQEDMSGNIAASQVMILGPMVNAGLAVQASPTP
jgi:hypothetical protein